MEILKMTIAILSVIAAFVGAVISRFAIPVGIVLIVLELIGLVSYGIWTIIGYTFGIWVLGLIIAFLGAFTTVIATEHFNKGKK